MEIKFLEILPRAGESITALFLVDNKKVKISMTDTLRTIWGINADKEVELALKQIGKLKIRLMITKEEEPKDFIFQTYEFQESGRILNFGEAIERLKNEILKADEEKHRIGFKTN